MIKRIIGVVVACSVVQFGFAAPRAGVKKRSAPAKVAPAPTTPAPVEPAPMDPVANEESGLGLSNSALPSENESWYFLFGLGSGVNKYNDENLTRLIDTLNGLEGVSHLPIGMDLGFFWPALDHKLMFGGAMSVLGDSYSAGDESLSVNSFGLNFSAYYYLGANIGKGLYFKSGIGPSFNNIDADDGDNSAQIESKTGLGLMIGTGYGIPVSNGTRLHLDFSYSYKTQDKGVQTFLGTVAVLL